MDKYSQNIISAFLGVEPIRINSALVSAQNRERLYWTNIPGVQQPADRCIYLRDIIEQGVVDRDKSYTIDANYGKGSNLRLYFEDSRRQIVFNLPTTECIRVGSANLSGHDYNRRVYSIDGKSPTLNTGSGGNLQPKIALDDSSWRILTPKECERLQTIPDDYSEGVSNTQRYRMIGNGWTVDVISHILSHIKEHPYELRT